MGWETISDLLISAVRMATPLLFVALAELYSERAGLVNIGLDGIMAFGSLVGFLRRVRLDPDARADARLFVDVEEAAAVVLVELVKHTLSFLGSDLSPRVE